MLRLCAVVLLLCAASAAHPQAWHGPDNAPSPGAPAPATTVSMAPAPGDSDHVRLGKAIARKLMNPEFAAARSQRGRLPPDSFGMPEEAAVREARDKLARVRRAPAGAEVRVIPRVAAAPTIDGQVGGSEWTGALRIALEPARKKAAVLLMVHADQLYLAALAPGDTTETGFDQFRFWYHLELSPFFENERAMIGGRGVPRTLRGVRLPGPGQPVRDNLDPKFLRQDVDWGVHGKLRGASRVDGFRQFEAAIDLAEAGLVPGSTFPAWLEIEGDPETEAGKFKARVNEGEIGSAARPIWLRLTP